jgi:antitoxin HicB
MKNRHLGGDFDEFLRDEHLLDDGEAAAAKRLIAFQIAREMKRARLSKSEMAHRMKTSRPPVDRLLDPKNRSVTLSSLERAAAAFGKKLTIELTQSARMGLPKSTPEIEEERIRMLRPDISPPHYRLHLEVWRLHAKGARTASCLRDHTCLRTWTNWRFGTMMATTSLRGRSAPTSGVAGQSLTRLCKRCRERWTRTESSAWRWTYPMKTAFLLS